MIQKKRNPNIIGNIGIIINWLSAKIHVYRRKKWADKLFDDIMD